MKKSEKHAAFYIVFFIDDSDNDSSRTKGKKSLLLWQVTHIY